MANEEPSNTLPVSQPYTDEELLQLRGRFVGNIASIRLFKDNIYIKDLPLEEKTRLNKELLKPFNGELFYDDENYVWVCRYTPNAETGNIDYVYVSKQKEVYEKLHYYETQGVLNQLISSYNNGRIYNFYVDRANNIMYPNNELVFPPEYVSYTVKAQGLNSKSEPIYVAGTLEDGAILDTHILMKQINDSQLGTHYSRMTPALIFGKSDPETGNYDEITNNNFYVIDFYNEEGAIIDSKLFQAIDAGIADINIPSQSIIDLEIQVLRANYPQTAAGNIYPVLVGEDVASDLSFNVVALFNDGTRKVITSQANTNQLVISGLEKINTNGIIGTQYEVKFKYFPRLDQNDQPIGVPVEKTIIFQLVANNYKKIYKIIPVMWKEASESSANNGNVYKLKIYTLSSDGVLENRTKSFYDTFKVFNINSGNLVECTYTRTYNPYQQCITFAPTSIIQDTIFSFTMYNESKTYEYRFIARFTDGDSNGVFIKPLANTQDYGYGNNDVLNTMNVTEQNVVKIVRTSTATNIMMKFEDLVAFAQKYSRIIDGATVLPKKIQAYFVKDNNYQPLIGGLFTFGATDKTLTPYLNMNDNSVAGLITSNSNINDLILVKFFDENEKCINIDTFRLVEKSIN